MINIELNPEKSKKEIWELISELFPIHRTLVSDGFQKSLEIIQKYLPIKNHEYESGSEVFDWIIPDAWDVKEAYIEDLNGRRIVDFKNNNLHLAAYSIPFDGRIKREDLLKHVNTLEEQPEAIPYTFHYFKSDWAFNLAHNQLKDITDEEYYVKVDVNKRKGTLKIGEYFIKGQTDKEIIISTYMCHPSMANDNLSGVVTSVELFKYLKNLSNPYYSYRLLILPETIGAVTFLASNEQRLDSIIGGYVIYCCGDEGHVTYKQSYANDSYFDKVARYALNLYREESQVNNFFPGGSDERQYNAPGIRKPFGAFNRTPAGKFKEYHTSLDNLSRVADKYLWDTCDLLLKTIEAFELDKKYKNNYKGEPCFSRHNITYPSVGYVVKKTPAYFVKILASEIDGNNSLFDIAEKWNLPIKELHKLALELENNNLIEEIPRKI